MGDGGANWFQGGGGKDTFTGGGGRDLYDYNLTSASPVGAGRDVITDFDHLTDDIDLMGIDADTHRGRQPGLPLGRHGGADRGRARSATSPPAATPSSA